MTGVEDVLAEQILTKLEVREHILSGNKRLQAASLSRFICEANGQTQTYVGLCKEHDQERGTFAFDSKQELTASLSFLALSEEALRSNVGVKTSPHTYKTPPGSCPAGEGTRPKQTGCQ